MDDPREAPLSPGVAPEILFLPGLDGEPFLRQAFLDALRESFPVTPLAYPNEKLGGMAEYVEKLSHGRVAKGGFILIGESFGALPAIRWAATDKRVRGLVLCGGFVRNPLGLTTKLVSKRPKLVKWLASHLLHPWGKWKNDPVMRRVIDGLRLSLDVVDAEVLGERLRLVRDYDARKALGRVKVPTVLLFFDKDLLVGETHRRYLETLCHNPDTIRLDGPHMALETRPRDCANALRAPLLAMIQGAIK